MLVYVNHADYLSRYKSDMKEKKNITRHQVQYIIKKYRIQITGTFEVSGSGLVDVRGSIKLSGNKIFKLPLKFGNVTGDFCCKGNGLETLNGAPKFVGGNFNCSDNKLTSLRNSPDYVGGSYFCQENSLDSLKGCPLEIISRFNCTLNNLESLKYGPKRVGKSFYGHHNRLKTLSGAPVFVGGSFNVAVNMLKNLEGCPDYIGENFHFDCWLPSLYMASKNCYVGGVKIESLEQIDNSDSILPEVILNNQKHLPILFSYNRYLPLYDQLGQLETDYIDDLLFEVKNGMR